MIVYIEKLFQIESVNFTLTKRFKNIAIDILFIAFQAYNT